MTRIQRHPFPQRTGPALDHLVDTMGRYCRFPTRLLLANRDILRPLYLRWLRRTGGMIGASSHTTFALTQASGSAMGNVIPTEASMFANLRLLWGDTTQSAIARLHRIIRDPQVEIIPHTCTDPRPDSGIVPKLGSAAKGHPRTWPHAVVIPLSHGGLHRLQALAGHLSQCLPILRKAGDPARKKLPFTATTNGFGLKTLSMPPGFRTAHGAVLIWTYGFFLPTRCVTFRSML